MGAMFKDFDTPKMARNVNLRFLQSWFETKLIIPIKFHRNPKKIALITKKVPCRPKWLWTLFKYVPKIIPKIE